jgi:hypothetical protein
MQRNDARHSTGFTEILIKLTGLDSLNKVSKEMSKTIIGTAKYFQPRSEWRGGLVLFGFFTVATYEGG